MAEVLGIIGGISAIVHLTEDFIKLTRELADYLENIRSAPKEIEYFLHETSIFTALLYYFQQTAGDVAEKLDDKLKQKRTKLVRMIGRQCNVVKGGFADLVKRFKQVNGTEISPVDALWARILWLLKKPDVVGLRLSLESAKANVSLLSNLFILEALMKKNKNDKRIEVLREQLRNAVQTARQLRKELAEHQRGQRQQDEPGMTINTSYEAITMETREIEKYVVNAIRSQKRREAHQSTPSNRRSQAQPPGPPEQRVRLPFTATGHGTERNRTDGHGRIYPPFDQTLINHPFAPNLQTDESVPRNIDADDTHVNRSASNSARVPPPPVRHLSEMRQCRSRTYGDRVRDHGDGVYIDIGEWPNQIHDSDADATDNVNMTDADRHNAREQKRMRAAKRGEIDEPDPDEQHVKPLGHVAEREENGEAPGDGGRSHQSRRPDPEDSQVGQNNKSSDEDGQGPYRPVAPFGGPGGRRRPRRPRPQTPLG
ncbi:hypothetical protein F5B20DRAFT_65038 [Whalleya microplaca]|nr:hypothetical protein F5B20DRAFT_65038 [Whalleya microplaca]